MSRRDREGYTSQKSRKGARGKAALRAKLQRATRVVVARARKGDFSGVVR
jgi:hypothetical protein